MAITEAQKKALMKIKGFRALKSQYEKQIKGSGMKRMKGMGFWDKFKKVVGDVDSFLKKTKVISKTGKLASAVLPFTPYASAVPVAAGITAGATALGYGKKRKAPVGKPMLSMDGRFTKPVLPTRPAVVVGRGQGRSIRQGVFNTVSSEFGKLKF